ncbi:hypothetical protein LSUB1_G000407 [Lachnellula subtilissima]|uniref:Uncharacterized protein n=1 Tax=Lachnellula subtilissima TaxID=602034 RepID=A0A8H8UIW7_9HELO|nr:hypothetical protein LSUB1_G000407 [Lachnellula subtilissima]
MTLYDHCWTFLFYQTYHIKKTINRRIITEKTLTTNMNVLLQPPSVPVAIFEDTISKGETSLTMYCHDRTFDKITVLGEANEKLFTVDSKGSGVLSWRRTVKDASGVHIFDIRHFGYAFSNKWVVESPSGREVATLRMVKALGREHSAFDMAVLNEADEGYEVQIKI